MPRSQIDNQAGVSLIPQLHYILQRGGCAKLDPSPLAAEAVQWQVCISNNT